MASDDAAQVLISGFRGSGKTTELKRLEKWLERDGFSVVFIDTEEYLNLRMPATISDLWISIAAGFDDFLQRALQGPHAIGKFWERFRAFLDREIVVSDVKINLADVGEFKVALRENPAFRVQLNEALEAKRPKLVHECRDFVEEGIAALRQLRLNTQGTVIIIDSFEKLAGEARTADDVRASAEVLFTRDWRLLQAPCNTIYTVPPWLAFTDAAADNELGRTLLMPMCKVREKHGGPCEAGIAALLDLLGRRMDVQAIFGDDTAIRPLIEMSGGYPRDLLRMVRDVLIRNIEVVALPIPREKLDATVLRVIQVYAEQYETGLDGEDLPLLTRIAREKEISGWTRKDKFRVAELFDHHFVLSYQNGERWLDLHPLLRDTPSMQKELRGKTGD
ncbi:MAG: hypothetical protein HYV27_20440 [Candidatus Hydrogenedentes bacterium]|nr:hypothetical protein [Candidatus Hydrogenedentota bacterium]